MYAVLYFRTKLNMVIVNIVQKIKLVFAIDVVKNYYYIHLMNFNENATCLRHSIYVFLFDN